jgi:hypothetical protein
MSLRIFNRKRRISPYPYGEQELIIQEYEKRHKKEPKQELPFDEMGESKKETLRFKGEDYRLGGSNYGYNGRQIWK